MRSSENYVALNGGEVKSSVAMRGEGEVGLFDQRDVTVHIIYSQQNCYKLIFKSTDYLKMYLILAFIVFSLFFGSRVTVVVAKRIEI